MTREELENELEVHGWKKSYHGTHSALWQKEDPEEDKRKIRGEKE